MINIKIDVDIATLYGLNLWDKVESNSRKVSIVIERDKDYIVEYLVTRNNICYSDNSSLLKIGRIKFIAIMAKEFQILNLREFSHSQRLIIVKGLIAEGKFDVLPINYIVYIRTLEPVTLEVCIDTPKTISSQEVEFFYLSDILVEKYED